MNHVLNVAAWTAIVVVLMVIGVFLGSLSYHFLKAVAKTHLPVRKKKKPESYEIGGKTYYPVKVTRPVMEQLMAAEYVPSPDERQFPFPFAQQPTTEARLAMLTSMYEKLSILLRDSEGEHPSPDELGVYLDYGEVFEILQSIMPD